MFCPCEAVYMAALIFFHQLLKQQILKRKIHNPTNYHLHVFQINPNACFQDKALTFIFSKIL